VNRLVRRAWPIGLVAASSLLPFAFAAFPSQDGPSHVGTSAILSRLLVARDPHFTAFFAWLPPGPNCLVHYLGMPLVGLFPARMAEKIIVSGLIAAATLALWSCARALRSRNGWLCAFAAPAGYSKALYAGNFNFVLSFVFCWLVLREIILASGNVGWKRGTRTAMLLLLAALAHPIGTVFALIGGGTLVLWYGWIGGAAGTRVATMARYIARFIASASPGLALLSLYLTSHVDAAAEAGPGIRYTLATLVRVKRFLGLGQLYTVDNWQIVVCLGGAIALLVLFAASLLARLRELRSGQGPIDTDGLLLVAAAMLLLFLAVPDGGAGAGYIGGRLDFVPWLVILLWLATRPLRPTGYAAAALLLGPVSVSLLVSNAVAIAKIQPPLAAASRAEAVLSPGWTVLAISAWEKPNQAFPGEGYPPSDPFEHLAHVAAADRALVMLNNWNAHYPGFPIRFRDSADPYRFFDPTRLDDKDLAHYEAATGHRIDAVVVFGAAPMQLARDHAALAATLHRMFCPAPIPADVGALFVRRGFDGGCQTEWY
jgi:hypothetical protein